MATRTALAATLARHITPALARDIARHVPPATARAIRGALARDARRQRIAAFRKLAQARGVLWLRSILAAHGVDRLSRLPDSVMIDALGPQVMAALVTGDPIVAYNAIADATGCKRIPTEPPTMGAALRG